MANLTVAIDDELLKQARIRAIEQNTSVNALVRDYLEGLAGVGKQRDALSKVLDLAASSHSGSSPKGRTWTRDELYDL